MRYIKTKTLEGDIYLVAKAVNHNAELLENALNRIKELEKEDSAEKPIRFEEFKPSEGMTREEAINLLDNLIGMVEDNHDSDYDIALQMAKKALEQEPFKNAYIQVVKERDIAIEQLNELGYSLGEKIRPCKKGQDPISDEAIAEIKKQEKWRTKMRMTNEEAIFCEKSYIGETNCTDCKYYGTDTCLSRESHKMAIKALEQEPVLDKIRAEIKAQEKWLAQAGYNAYNVSVAFGAIKHALEK